MSLQRYDRREVRIVPIVPIDTNRAIKLRFAEIMHNKSHSLRGEVFGVPALMAAVKGLRQSLAAAYPTAEVVASHMRRAVGEIHQGKTALGIAFDNHILRHVKYGT